MGTTKNIGAAELPEGELSPEQRVLCDHSLMSLTEEDEAEFISVGIDRNAPPLRPIMLWLTEEDGTPIGFIRMGLDRARKVAADILAVANDS